jgi:predicted amidohydrolase
MWAVSELRSKAPQKCSNSRNSRVSYEYVLPITDYEPETHLRVALVQYPHDRDAEKIVAEAKASGAHIVVFPEMFSNGYTTFDKGDPGAAERWRDAALRLDSDFIKSYRDAALTHQISVVATFLEEARPKPYNSALLIDSEGRTVLHHRKVHICDFDNPESECAPGRQLEVAEVNTSAGPVKLGLLICMDREYPETARSLSAAGAEIVLIPNCCHLATDPVVGDVRIGQLRGRAFEMVIGMAVANYPAPRCDGHSFAVDATGAIIAMADESPGLTIAAFDLAQIRRTRTEEHFRWRL